MVKACSKCKQEKPLGEFYRNRGKTDGRQSRCKTCMLEVQRQYAQTEPGRAYMQEYLRRYFKTEPGKTAQRRYNETDAGRKVRRTARRRYKQSEKGKKAQLRYRLKNPQKVVAHNALNQAIRAGKLERGLCEVCGTIFDVHGHHANYNEPLNVAWLCNQHHSTLHEEKRSNANR